MEKEAFNLCDEAWIPVLMSDGSERALSLRETLLRAKDIRAITGEMPQMSFALLRLLLAILYRVYEAEDAVRADVLNLWEDLWDQGEFDAEEVEAYLEDTYDGFYLFGEAPFYQTPDLAYADGHVDPVSTLMPDVPKREKYLFAMRAPQCVASLSYAEAARYLLLAQAYDTAGIKSPVESNTHVNKGKVYAPKGAVGTGWCGAIGGVCLEGKNLFETLMLNWVLYDDFSERRVALGVPGDLPPWERLSAGPDLLTRDPVGPVDMLTWQSRRIRLIADPDARTVTGVMICYGDITTAVDKQQVEGMTAWRGSEAQQKRLKTTHVPFMPRLHQPGQALWRGLPAMLVSSQAVSKTDSADLRPGVVRWVELLEEEGIMSDSYPLTIHAQGMTYGTQSSVFEDGLDDRINLHAVLLRHDAGAQRMVVELVEHTEQAVKELVRFVQRVEACEGDKRRYDSVSDAQASAVRSSVREHAYDELDGLFRNRVAHFTPEVEPEAYGNAWHRDTKAVLWSLARSYLSSSGADLFSERGTMTPGRALLFLRSSLAKILPTGDQPVGQEAALDSNEGTKWEGDDRI